MNRSRVLALACSAALLGAGGAAWAQQSGTQQGQKSQQQAQQKQQSQRSSPHNQVAKQAGEPTNVIVTGDIIDARDVTLAATAGDKHRLFRVKTNAGREVVVDIGVPQGQISEADLKKGDRIVAMGKPARINGRPVLFAANVAELQKVERTMMSQGATSQQGRSTSSQTAGQAQQRQAQSGQQASQQRSSGQQAMAGTQDTYDTVIVFFETENLGQDDYGYYDEDFAWTTNDRVYDGWNDTSAWDDTERAHFDMFGYDDAGEAGIWDW